MTDYYYQARLRDELPETEGGHALANALGRRNLYPPEDEAYWAEAGAPPAEDEPLWYEDRVGQTGGHADPEPFPPEPLPPEPAATRRARRGGWGVFRRRAQEPDSAASPAAELDDDAQSGPPPSEAAESRPQRGWRPFRRKRSEPAAPVVASAELAEGAAWSEQPAEEAAITPPPAAAGPRRPWRLFRAKPAAAELPAASATAEEAADADWPDTGPGLAEPDAPLWYEDRVRRNEASPSAPRPASSWPEPASRSSPTLPADPYRPTEWRAPDPAYYPEPEPDPPTYAAWAEPASEAYADPWQAGRDAAPHSGDEEAGQWAEEPNAGQPMEGSRAYVPGAAAAAARAAAEAGERNIRFDPTKERGPEYHDRAARHSRRVRLLKFALPVIALLSVVGFFGVMSFDAADDGLPALNLSGIDFEEREIVMDKPNISGFEGTKRAYEIHAVKAVQALGDTKVVTLETIAAKFALGDNVRANLEAATGVYDSNTQKLRLTGGIKLSTSNGYTAELKDANVDVEAGNVDSTTGVMIRGKEGMITSDSIEVLDRGKHVFFRGNVKVVFHPSETPDKPDTTEEAGGTAAAPAPDAAPAVIEAARDGST